MKKFLIVGIIFLSIILGVCILMQNNDSINDIRFIITEKDNTIQQVSLYENNGIYYAFLPSYTQLNNVTISSQASHNISINGENFKPEVTCSNLHTDTKYTITVFNDFGSVLCEETLVIMKSSNISTLSITLLDGNLNDINNSETKISKSGFIRLIENDGTTNYAGVAEKIYGRGNSSWNQTKKSYNLRFQEYIDLLDMGAAQNWVLLANSFDESGLRNKLAYELSKKVGVKYPIDTEYVDLYIDDVYYGLYLLSEKIEISESRVNITDLSLNTSQINTLSLSNYPIIKRTVGEKIAISSNIPNNPTDITGGYLLQIDHYDDLVSGERSGFQTEDLDLTLSSPKYASMEQIDYISDYFTETEQCIKNGDLSRLDVQSFVDYYFVQELLANNDSFSVFFYKDSDAINGKITACSIWDFDLSIGNGWHYPDYPPDLLNRNKNNWFNYLWQTDEFRQKLKEKYTNFLNQDADLLTNMLLDISTTITPSFNMNHIRWSNVVETDNSAQTSQKSFNTIEEHVQHIKSFMEARIEFLKSAWIEDVSYCKVSFISSDNGAQFTSKVYSVKKNSKLNANFDELDSYLKESNNHNFNGWHTSDGEKYSPGMVITEDLTFLADWKDAFDSKSILQIGILGKVFTIFKNLSIENKITLIGLGTLGLTTFCIITKDIYKHIKLRRKTNDE